MRLRDFFTLSESIVTKKLGRAFNHLEDLVFFYGSAGTKEALQHIKEMSTAAGSQSIRMKWDGFLQVYWGREESGGPLIFGGHNSWSRKQKTANPDEIRDFIANKSGNPLTPIEQAARDQFADRFSSLYNYFDAATPSGFVGYVYADVLFWERPAVDADGIFNFCPNPKSKTCYHVKKDSQLGERISQASIMVVGHAFFEEWGMPDSAQKPISDFSQFNNTNSLIVMGPVYNQKPVEINTSSITQVQQYLNTHASQIDNFLEPQAGLSDLREIFYRYVNQQSKLRRLGEISGDDFLKWLENDPKITTNKLDKIIELNNKYNYAIDAIFTLVKMIQVLKDSIIDQVEGAQGEIWDTHGEGRVRYAGTDKQFGHVKLVPRTKWVPQ